MRHVPTKVKVHWRQSIALVAAVSIGSGVVISTHLLGADRAFAVNPLSSNPTHRTKHHGSFRSFRTLTLHPLHLSPMVGSGRWRPVGRRVNGYPAVFSTTSPLPDNSTVTAGIAWIDTKLLRARLYSGSLSPGGFNWRLTAPVSPAASTTLVTAFNGGFLMKDSRGGYLSEGDLVAPLRYGAASLVIYKSGLATVGQWGRDVTMTSSVVAVRQNLTLLVDHGQPVAGLKPNDISNWGMALNGIANTWRSGLGVTANGALVYVVGPMNIVDLAKLLVRAGAIRAMTLDMNPLWPVFATYAPIHVGGRASPANGTDLLRTMVQSPQRFFQPTYSRDFIAMFAR